MMRTRTSKPTITATTDHEQVDLYKTAYNFIRHNRAGSLATTDENGIPHVVVIYGIVHKDLSIYFSTRVEGRKFQNLMKRPTVALTFFNEDSMESIQLTGKAERINDLAMEQEILYKLILYRYGEPNWPVPPVKMFEEGATNELAIVKVTPTELTYASFETIKEGRYKPFFKKII